MKTDDINVEPLEGRVFMSAGVSIAFRDHILVLRAPNAASILSVILDPDGIDLDAAITLIPKSGQSATKGRSPKLPLPLKLAMPVVKEIKFVCGTRGDMVEVGAVGSPLDIPSTIVGGPGNDTIVGGSARDLIYSGGGNDSIDGGAGPDTIWAGTGEDVIRYYPGDVYHTGAGGSSIQNLAFIPGTT